METTARPAEGREVELVEKAAEAAQKAGCAYSNFHVGAAMLLDGGTIITGFNWESPAFSVGICAERMCLFTALSQRNICANDVIMFAIHGQTKAPISPCGACRQVMMDILGPDCPVLLSNCDNEIIRTTVSELLPMGFKEGDLK